MPRREKSLHERIMEHINSLPGCLCRKRHSTIYARRGDPDLYGSLCGRHFEVEVKKPGEKPTKTQQQRLEEWASTGALAFWADDFEVACEVIDAHLAERDASPRD